VIGKALAVAAVSALEAEGSSKAALLVKSGNAVGNAFWEKLRFGAREDVVYRDRALGRQEEGPAGG
jgi:ribosomal protein S18 acetylase RimI-like enzyme